MITSESYEALLRWLIENTAVQRITLSWRVMTRLRTLRTNITATFNLSMARPRLSLLRTIKICTHSARSMWELTRMREFRRALSGSGLPQVQAYVFEDGGQHDVLLDPRWDVRKTDDDGRKGMMKNIGQWLDVLLAEHRRPPEPDWRGEIQPWLYQVCFVFGRS